MNIECRQRKGEELEAMDIKELRGLEQTLDESLRIVRQRKVKASYYYDFFLINKKICMHFILFFFFHGKNIGSPDLCTPMTAVCMCVSTNHYIS